MKKVRISLRDSSKKWTLPLYESLTSYFYLHSNYTNTADKKFREIVTLNKGEFLEIEWLGSDYCQIDEFGMFLDAKLSVEQMKNHCDHVRIGKSIRKSGRKGFDYVTGYIGYAPGGYIPWIVRNSPSYLKVIKLKGRFKPRIDFSELFEDNKDPTADMLLEAAEEAGIC